VTRQTRVASFLIVAMGAATHPSPLKAQEDTATAAYGCRTAILAEQLRDHCFNYDVLGRVIPGFADLTQHDQPSCAWTVYLTNPATQADSARKVLSPIVYKPLDPADCSETGITVQKARYSWPKLRTMETRASDIIDTAGYWLRSFPRIEDGRLVVTVHNRRALARLRRLFSRDSIARSSVVVFKLADGPEEIDPPIKVPRAATLIVLDSLAAHYAGNDIVAFDVSTLPDGVTASDVVARGLRLKAANDPPCKKRKMGFWKPRAWVDGRIQLHVDEVERDWLYDIWCTPAGCAMRSHAWPGSGDISIC